MSTYVSLKIYRGGETDTQRQKERHREGEGRGDTQAQWALQKQKF